MKNSYLGAMNTEIARQLDEAAKYAVSVPQVAAASNINLEDAYKIQRQSIDRRYHRGEKSIGIKLGFTSRAKMQQMGVSDMIWGWLTDTMLYQNGDKLPLHKFIHPRAEPEICFVASKEINRELTLQEAKGHIGGLAVAIEIIDSRFQNFKFSLEDVIADNCSSSALVVGEILPIDTNLSDVSMQLMINNEEKQSGNTDAILGNPWESVVAASRLVSEAGLSLPEGSLIMAGAATAAEYLKLGDHVKAVLGGSQSVSLHVN